VCRPDCEKSQRNDEKNAKINLPKKHQKPPIFKKSEKKIKKVLLIIKQLQKR
jgi:hypothetical protein